MCGTKDIYMIKVSTRVDCIRSIDGVTPPNLYRCVRNVERVILHLG